MLDPVRERRPRQRDMWRRVVHRNDADLNLWRRIGEPRHHRESSPIRGPAREHETGADIPDEDSLQADACSPGYHYDSNQRLLIESKEHMRARGVRSPDEWDAFVLTFAEPVADKVMQMPKRDLSWVL